MNTLIRLLLLPGSMLALTLWPLRAQIVADGATNTLSNVTTNLTGDVTVGTNLSFTLLMLSDNALLTNSGNGVIGLNSTAKSNEVRLISATARWLMGPNLFVGSNGSFNRLVVSNGAVVADVDGFVGHDPGASNNLAVVTGVGSLWTNSDGLLVGYQEGRNQLVVSNGGVVVSGIGYLGYFASANNNLAVVTGAGSMWSNRLNLNVGLDALGNRLVVSNGAIVFASNAVYVGFAPTSTNNRVTVDGGTLRVTNAAGTGVLDVRRGTNVLNAGLVEADQLLLVNAAGRLEFSGGTLSTGNTTGNNGQFFRVGNGVSPATLNLVGDGVHTFSLNVFISSNAVLTGNGFINVTAAFGRVVVEPGGTLAPGGSIGKIDLFTSPLLQGTVSMEISKNGSVLTNDQIEVAVGLAYGGALTVAKLGATALTGGDRFQLFSASSYAGSFTTVTLPSLPAGLNWTNKLLVDGSIEVIAGPQFTSVTVSGTNVILTGTNGTPNAPYAVLTATNVALPLSNWVSIATNLFDSSGNFSFTNAITPGIPQRFYRLRTP
jgi:T5SS/PEP-CTERM-associated repeat protein